MVEIVLVMILLSSTMARFCDAWMASSTWSSITPSRARTRSMRHPTNNRVSPKRSLSFLQQKPQRYMVLISSDDAEFATSILDVSSPLLVGAVALGLGIGAQSFINQMLKGDQGLGAFLKDGSGYNRSGFRNKKDEAAKPSDPLPWLQLPKLDFVQVAGQEEDDLELAYEKLEEMRVTMNEQLQQGNVQEASRIRGDLELFMKEARIEYTADGEPK